MLAGTTNPAPVLTPPQNCRVTPDHMPVRINTSFTLTAVCAAGGPVSSYTFIGPSGAPLGSGPGNTVTVQATTLGSQTYTVRAQNSGGQASASTQVTVVPLPPSSCRVTPAPNPILLGQQTILTMVCAGGGAPATYTFTLPNGSVVTQETGALAVVPTVLGNQNYSVV